MTTTLVERLIAFRDTLTNRADRDLLADACNRLSDQAALLEECERGLGETNKLVFELRDDAKCGDVQHREFDPILDQLHDLVTKLESLVFPLPQAPGEK